MSSFSVDTLKNMIIEYANLASQGSTNPKIMYYYSTLVLNPYIVNHIANTEELAQEVANHDSIVVSFVSAKHKSYVNSETFMNIIANSETAMNAVANSETAMNIIANSETAMNAIANSETALDAVVNSPTASRVIHQTNPKWLPISDWDTAQVACYLFEGNANDAFGNYNGTWSGNEQYTESPWGQCVDYRSKSSSDYIMTPVIDRKGSKEFSLSFWINIENHTGKWLSVFHLTPDGQDLSSNSRQPAIWLCQSDNRKFHVKNDGVSHSNIGIETSNATLSYNQWFFVTVSITLRQIKLFLNASLTDTYSSSEDFKFNNGIVYIGGKWYDKNHLIDNLRIFNRALTDEEVQRIYLYEKNVGGL